MGEGDMMLTHALGRALGVPLRSNPAPCPIDVKRHMVLVPSGAEGTLSVIQLAPVPKVVATVPTAKSARTIALDPATGRAYLPAADLMPAVGNERPKPVPGTFRILVVAPSS